MKTSVDKAIEQIRKYFQSGEVQVREDGNGGAYVLVSTVDLGEAYTSETRVTWIGFHLAYNYPAADIYPHHVRPDLMRADGKPFGQGMHTERNYDGFNMASTMLSRRTNKTSWSDQTALVKLLKVIEWAGGDIERKAA